MQDMTRSIGDIISVAKNLTPDQVEQVLNHQKANGTRFGESVVALGLARSEDVIWALSQQFDYPYAPEGHTEVSSELVVATNPFDAPAEFFRDVRSQLLERSVLGAGKGVALAVCSPESGDGRTFFAANLAIAFSQLGGRTLLIDGDLRTPRLHKLFEIGQPKCGVSSALAGRAEANVIQPLRALPSLFVMPVDIVPPNPLELVQKAGFDELLSGVLGRFDHVIVDTPAASYGADARVIAAKCGAAVVVARKNVTRAKALQGLVKQLRSACPGFFGTVLNEHVS